VQRELLTVEQAQREILTRVTALGSERVPIAQAAGRILARDVPAEVDLPLFVSSAMDGFAVRTQDVPGSLRVVGEIRAGAPSDRRLEAGEAMAISTGGAVPAGADAVVPIEYVVVDDNTVEVPEPAAVAANLRPLGGDVRRGEVVVEHGRRVAAAQLGALAAAGIAEVECGMRPRVITLATGSELVAPGEPLPPGSIYEANTVMLAAAARRSSADVERLPPVTDDAEAHRRALARGLESDVLVTSGGVSVGAHDLVRRVAAELGVEEVFWGVAVKPGKPVVFGVRGRTLVFGLPGNPVSSLVGFELFVRPALLALQGASEPLPRFLPARLGRSVRSNRSRDQLLRARTRADGDVVVVEPLAGQESHMIARAATADALVHVPRGEADLREGDVVRHLRLE
jgi:molybdopterin molybdotransferase